MENEIRFNAFQNNPRDQKELQKQLAYYHRAYRNCRWAGLPRVRLEQFAAVASSHSNEMIRLLPGRFEYYQESTFDKFPYFVMVMRAEDHSLYDMVNASHSGFQQQISKLRCGDRIELIGEVMFCTDDRYRLIVEELALVD